MKKIYLIVFMYVNIDILAQYEAPTTGLYGTANGGCSIGTNSGTYTDDGGVSSNYSNNINDIYQTFCPTTEGESMVITFTSFNTEAGVDYIKVANGPSALSTVFTNSPANFLGEISGTPTVPFSFTSTTSSGCLSIFMYTNFTTTRPGFEATLSTVNNGSALPAENSDCSTSKFICSNTAFNDNSNGPGLNPGESCVSSCFTGEVYSNWYTFSILTSGTINLDIIPQTASDDYDFTIYGPGTSCGAAAPIRCSASELTGTTGLRPSAIDVSEFYDGDKFVAPLNVLAGETYQIMVNKWSAGGTGFNLTFGGTATIGVIPPEINSATICRSESATLTATPSKTGGTYLWSPGGETTQTITVSPLTSTSYSCIYTIDGCSSDAGTADVTVITTAPPTTGLPNQRFCSIMNRTITSLIASGTNISWYSAPSGGSPLPSNTPLVTGTTYYATQTIGGCESDTRLAVNVTIDDPNPPTTSNPTQTFCAIDNSTVANLSATGTAIVWYNASSGGTVVPNNTPLVSGTTYYATQTVTGCQSDTRLAVTVTINDPNPPTTSNPTQTFCAIDNSTVANLSATGTAIVWYNASSGGTVVPNNTPLVSGTTYYATQTVTGCQSDTRLAVTVTINDPNPPTTSNPTQTFCAIDNSTVANLSATGTAIVWYNASSGGTVVPNNTPLVSGTTYYATQTVTGCQSDTRLAVTVTINDPNPPTTSNPTQTFCAIDNSTVANLSATGTAIVWYNASSGGTVVPNNTPLVSGTTYYATQTATGCQSDTRLAVTVTINDPNPPTTSNPTQTFCAINNSTVANLSATGTAIVWYNASSGGTVVPNNTPLVSGTTYYATQTVTGCQSDTRLAVTVTINDPNPPTTSNPTQTFCAINNSTVANLSATGTAIVWYNASSGGTVVPNNTPLVSGTTYYATQTVSGCQSDTRLAVTVTINDPNPPTTSNATQTFCAIDNSTVANLSATGTAIVWYNASSGGTVVLNNTPLVSGTTYYATQTVSGCQSDTRLAVTVTINDPNPPTTSNATQTFCAIDNSTVANLSATGTAIVWYNASSGGTVVPNNTPLVSGTTYYATQTVTGCQSDTRLAVTVTINDPNPPTTSNATQTFCAIDNSTVANLSATGTAIVWYNASSGGTVVPNTTPLVSETSYYATQTVSGCQSDTRLAVTVTINDPNPPTTSNTAQTFCAIDNSTVANLSATGTAIVWYNASSGGTVVPNTTPLVSETSYYATQTVSGCQSDTRLAVTVTINDPNPPTTSNPTQTFCAIDNSTVANLSATGTANVWYNASAGGTVVPNNTPLVSGTTYYATQTVSGCQSDTRLAVTVTINDPNPPTTSNATQTFCAIDNSTVANLSATGTAIVWYNASAGGTVVPNNTPLVSGTTYYATQTVSGCQSDTRLAVTVTINDPNPPSGPITQTFCLSENKTISDIELVGSSIIWYSSTEGENTLSSSTLLENSTTYYASQTVNGCESNFRLAVTITIIENPTIPAISADATYCNFEDQITLTGTTSLGGSLIWYADEELLDSIGSGSTFNPELLLGSNKYYLIEVFNGCKSPSISTNQQIIECDVEIPTAFTPDGNNINDIWELEHLDDRFPANKVIIYNRWGTKIYESETGKYTSNPWDGTYEGKKLPVASYYYVIELNNEKIKNKTGTVTIINK
jgi:large repetitive protein